MDVRQHRPRRSSPAEQCPVDRRFAAMVTADNHAVLPIECVPRQIRAPRQGAFDPVNPQQSPRRNGSTKPTRKFTAHLRVEAGVVGIVQTDETDRNQGLPPGA
jgi:hypothetical protein